MNIGVIIILALFGGLIFFWIISFISKKSKGKISINLSQYEFRPGDKVSGTINLKLKKQLEARELSISLRAVKTSSTGKESRSRPIFDFKKPLKGKGTYPIGEHDIPFEISIPTDSQRNSFENKALNSAVKSAQILLGVGSRTIWYLEANLDIPGFDLSKQIKINVI